MRLPMSFFSEERKEDIIARISGDVGEAENSITSSLDMLMKSSYYDYSVFCDTGHHQLAVDFLYYCCVAGNGLADGRGYDEN